MKTYLPELVTFLRHTISNFHRTGAVVPSSPWLAKALAEPLIAGRPAQGPMHVLEAGPGTGALTVEIVQQLRPGDHLTLCEISDEFVEHLQMRFKKDPKLAPWRKQVTLHHGAVQDMGCEKKFHHIVSGLPFNNFEPELVRQIFDSFETMLVPGGTVSFFEYVGLRNLKAPFANDAERERLKAVEQVLDNVGKVRPQRRRLMLYNFPPAWVCLVQG